MMHDTAPPLLTTRIRSRVAAELSWPTRLRYVCLLLAASTMTVIVVALLLTEPALPLRTSFAFVGLAAIGGSWTLFAVWVLSRRRILLGWHRVVAGRIAVIASTVFVAGSAMTGAMTGWSAAWAAAGLGAVMLVVATALLRRARRSFLQLSQRRAALELELEGFTK